MSVLVRGVKNSFRNWLRSAAVILILAIGLGLALAMLVANEAVKARIDDLKQQIGTTLLVRPAGSSGFMGGGEPLTNSDIEKVKTAEYIKAAAGQAEFVLMTDDGGDGNTQVELGGSRLSSGKTSLISSIEAGTLGMRFNARGGNGDVKLPVHGVGTDSNLDRTGNNLKIKEGRGLNPEDTNTALLGEDLAAKNNLGIGSTFTAYGEIFTVAGIFDQGTKFENNSLAIPLATAQRLGGNSNEVSVIVAQADSLENLAAAEQSIKNALGTDKADVTSQQESAETALASLQSVQNISLVGFVGALVAAVVVVLLIMVVIVRERRREIGVLKAIGGSNHVVVAQFMVEAVVLVAIASVVGMALTFVSSGPIASALVSSSKTGPEPAVSGGPAGGRAIRLGGGDVKDASSLIGSVTASVGPATLLYGFAAMILVAIIGSAVPAWLITKVRPAEVMRGE